MARKRFRSAFAGSDRHDQEVANYPSADQIAERAHELFISGGRRIARIPDYWRTAEAELLAQAVERVISTKRR